MRICAAQLRHAGAVEDALLIHRARRSSMDATGAVDGQLMSGPLAFDPLPDQLLDRRP